MLVPLAKMSKYFDSYKFQQIVANICGIYLFFFKCYTFAENIDYSIRVELFPDIPLHDLIFSSQTVTIPNKITLSTSIIPQAKSQLDLFSISLPSNNNLIWLGWPSSDADLCHVPRYTQQLHLALVSPPSTHSSG